MRDRSLFEELRQRHVFQVAAIYLAVAWGAVEMLDTVADRLFLPAWVPTLAVIVFVVGFPATMVLAWIFDIGKSGVRRSTTTAGKASIVASLILMTAGTAGLYYLIRPALYEATGEVDVSSYVATDTSLAILPFLDLSGDDEAFVAEFTARLIQVARTIGSLDVAGRDSSFWFKDRNSDPATVGEMLGVAHILEGTFRRSDGGVRVSAQLRIADSGQTLWSETWEDSGSALNDVEANIAERVAKSLSAELTETDELELRARPKTTVAVQELIALANREVRTRTREGFERAVELTEQAAELDPEYSPTWVNRAFIELAFLSNHQHRPIHESLDIARHALIRAADLGDQSPDFHAATAALLRREGHVQGYTPEQEEQLIAALERGIAGKSANAYIVYSIYERRRGELESAAELLRDLLAQDPLHRSGNMLYSRVLNLMGESERAIERLEKLVQWYPDYIQAWMELGVTNSRRGRYDEAIAALERGAAASTETLPPIYVFNQAQSWMAIGEPEKGAEIFAQSSNDFLGFPSAIVPCTVQGDFERCYALGQEVAGGHEPVPPYDAEYLTWLALLVGRPAEAANWIRQSAIGLAHDPPRVNVRNRDNAVILAAALAASGEAALADALLGQLEPLMGGEPDLSTVYFHLARRDREQALQVFETLVANGWRGVNANPMTAGYPDPLLKPIADDPRFIALMEEIQADLAVQRARLPELLAAN